jgi:pilus assembly protein Flp/PilA
VSTPAGRWKNSTREEDTNMNNTLLKLYVKMQTLNTREDGQDLVEYALVLALISVAATAALTVLSGKITSVFSAIGTDL